jgi:hypothetical protein
MSEERKGVALACERTTIIVAISQLVPRKAMRPGTKDSNKYNQILASVRVVGLVEPPVVTPDLNHPGQYFLQDGHLRIEALKALGVEDVECLVAISDDTYTYNKRINRLPPIQEHRRFNVPWTAVYPRSTSPKAFASTCSRSGSAGGCSKGSAPTRWPSWRSRHVRLRCSTYSGEWRPFGRSRRLT